MNKQIIFFDGVCNLCNGFVDFLIDRDHTERFLFAPLQGDTAKARLPKGVGESLQSMALLRADGEVLIKSDAALAILIQLGGAWKLMGAARILPRFLRNLVYDFVAANRYGWFGKRDSCRLPSAAEKAKFLP